MSTRIVFMGTPDFAVASLDALHKAGHNIVGVVTVPDKPSGRGQKINYSPVKEYALANNLNILQPEKLRDETFLSQLKELDADMFVVVAFRMLPKVVWAMPRLGTFNLHASLLPQYRGAAPINWAIINGETTTGVTTFLLNEKIDEGKILLQESIAINESDTAETIHDKLADIGKNLVVKTVEGLVQNNLCPTAQPNDSIELKPAPKIFKADCAIDWNKKGSNIVNFVRGLSTYPAATMTLKDYKDTVLSFKVFEVTFEQAENAEPFKVYTDQKEYLKIGISDGYIYVKVLQLSGKRKNTIGEFLRGNNVTNCTLLH